MRRLAIFSFAFALAAAGYVWLRPAGSGLPAGLLLLFVGLGLYLLRIERVRRLRIALLGLAFGLLWTWGYERWKLEPLRALCGTTREIQVEVCEMPRKTAYGVVVTGRLENGGRVRIFLDDSAQELSLGDRLRLTAELSSEENLFDLANDIALCAYPVGTAEASKCQRPPARYVPQLAAEAVRRKIARIFSADTADFARALLTGDRSGLSYETSTTLSVAGISHIVAVSGMHVSLLVGVVQALCFRRRLAAGCSVAAMAFFAAMLGFTPSVTRAVVMNTALLLAPLLGRENDAPTSLGFALLLILLGNPWAVASVSLQLSFGAMAGILLFQEPLQRRMTRRWENVRRPGPGVRLLRAVAGLLSMSFSAVVFTLPVVAAVFGTVSLVSPLTNLLAVPLLSAVFALGCLAVAMGFVCAPLGRALGWLLDWPIRLALRWTAWLAGVPYGAVYTQSVYVIAWLFAAYLLLAVFLLSRRKRLRLLFLSLAATLLCAVLFTGLGNGGDCSVTALDVGQGQCILLQSGGMTAVVDCGGQRGAADGELAVRKLLMSGEDYVDALILTHYDTDHVGGVEQLLARIPVGRLFLPDLEPDNENRAQILTAAYLRDVPVTFVTEDLELQFSGGSLRIFAPGPETDSNSGLSALMSAAECDILITGDMSAAGERDLLAREELPELEVLVAGHHGSRTSVSRELLEALRPAAVLISVGENRYGHPAQEVLDRIAAVGAQVFRTDQDGDITILR